MSNQILQYIQADINTTLLEKLTIDAQGLSVLATSINNTLTSISPLIPNHYQKNNLVLPTIPTPPNLSNINPNDDVYIDSLAEFHQSLVVFNNLINSKLEHLSFHSNRIGFDSRWRSAVSLPSLHPSHPSSGSEFSGQLIKDQLTFGQVSPRDLSTLLLENGLQPPPHFSDKDIAYLLPLYESIYTEKNVIVSDDNLSLKRVDVELRLTELEKSGIHTKGSLEEYTAIAYELNELKNQQSIGKDSIAQLHRDLTNFAHTPSDFSIHSDNKDILSFDLTDIDLLKKIEQAHYLSTGTSLGHTQFSLNRYSDESNTFLAFLDSSLELLLNPDHSFNLKSPTHISNTSSENKLLRLDSVIHELNKVHILSKLDVQNIINASDVLLGRTENSEAIFNLNDVRKKYLKSLPKNSIIEHVILDAYDVDADTSDKIIATIDSYLLNNGTNNFLIRIDPMVSPEDIVDITNTLESVKNEVRGSSNPLATISEITDRLFLENGAKKHAYGHLIKHNSSDRTPTSTNKTPYDGINRLIKNDNSPIAYETSFIESTDNFFTNFHTKPPAALLLNGALDAKNLSNTINNQQENVINKLYSEREVLLDKSIDKISKGILDASPNQPLIKSLWLDIKKINPFKSDLEPINLATSFDHEANIFKITTNKQNTL